MTRKRRKPTNQQTSQPTNKQANQPTIETALWILVAVVALALRLARLDAAPLSVHEAREAMLAWRAATGQGMPEAGYSPLLFTVNAFLFALCGVSDGLARLWPALCGSALTLTPFLLRRHIGRVGALVAGLCLTFSPILLFASRQLDGAVVAALGGMLFLGGLICFFDTESDTGDDTGGTDERPWLVLSAGGLALTVTSSPSAYGLLLSLGLASFASMSFVLVWTNKGIRWLWTLLSPHLSYVFAVFLFTGLLLSTTLGWNLAGLGAVGDLLPAWISRFGPAPSTVALPLTFLIVYEPLALLFSLGGLIWAIWRSHRLGILLGMWAGTGILLLVLMPGRTELDVLWLLLPLVLLVGIAAEQLVQSFQEHGGWLNEGLHIPVVVLLWVHLYLMLARYAVFGNATDLALALLTVALQGTLTVIFALAMRFDTALRAVAVGTGVVLLVMMISAGWGVAHVRPSDLRELLTRDPTAIEVRDLVQTLGDLSWRETGLPLTLPFILETAPDSVLAWYLRDFAAARRVENLDVGYDVDVVLVTTRPDLQDLELLGAQGDDDADDAGYLGQKFALHRSWDLAEVTCVWEWPPRCQSVVGWWLFRHTPTLPAVDKQVTLWVPGSNE